MKTIFSLLLLFAYLNVALIPQLPETDVYDFTGKQIDDVNSVSEWISIVLGLDSTIDDEDSDNGQSYVNANFFIANFTPPFSIFDYISSFLHLNIKLIRFSLYSDKASFNINLSTESPPPEF